LVSREVEVNESAGEVGGLSTVDHADIRGSAEAAFMVIIRRELPGTGLADLAPHNGPEGSPPLAGSSADSFTPVVTLVLGGALGRQCLLGLLADGPDEADQLAR
jgi:hypothetical protein